MNQKSNPSNQTLSRMQSAPYSVAVAVVLCVAAYLCLVNLDYAALWHDEAPAALLAKNLLQLGDIVGWDGRNLVGGPEGRTLNADLRDVLPPLMYVINAIGFALFGVNEIGARIMHAIIGILALGIFYLLLRQHLPKYPRLVFFIFVFAAGSAQLLLYFRQSRYFAVMTFSLLLIFYLYERYWQSKHLRYLPLITLVALLAFFNHYTAGTAAMLSLATWHLLFRARETTLREWGLFALCGIAVAVIGIGYLYWIGVIGGERSGYSAFTGTVTHEQSGIEAVGIFFFRIWIYARELFTTDWISWSVFLWFAGMLIFTWQSKSQQAPSIEHKNRRQQRKAKSRKTTTHLLPLFAAGKIILIGALFALFSAMLSVQPMSWQAVTDLRYYMAALPLLLVMKGLFVEWAWRRHMIAGAVALAVLLFTNIGAAPFNIPLAYTSKNTLGLHLFQFVREIHRPYRESISLVSNYLLENAKKDDLVYTSQFADREALTFYLGEHVRFCCMLSDKTKLPIDKVAGLQAPHLYRGKTLPDWIVMFRGLDSSEVEQFKVNSNYRLATQLKVYPYPTQRPELNAHAFVPLQPNDNGVRILRRISTLN